MISIKIDDVLFSHAIYSTDFQESKYIKWDRNIIKGNEDIAIWTDNSLSRVNKSVKNKIAWLLESPAVSYNQHEWIKSNYHLFDNIFTNNKDLLNVDEKFKFVPTGGCWIKPVDQKIWNKNKLTSIIASSKKFTDGHSMRHKVLNEIENIDKFGRGFNFINYKLDGLKDYMFSIVIENTKKDYYFTEKLIDCFTTGTIPIYWGCPSIGDFFDINGILTFDTIDDLKNIINVLNENLYKDKINSVNENFNLSKEYLISEDYIYKKYLIL